MRPLHAPFRPPRTVSTTSFEARTGNVHDIDPQGTVYIVDNETLVQNVHETFFCVRDRRYGCRLRSEGVTDMGRVDAVDDL